VESQPITTPPADVMTSQITKSEEKRDQTEIATSKHLTPEEQMALYEKSLKEDDWGHQPC